MEIIDNVNKTLKDDMLVTLRSGSKVAIAASCFSIYAFQELKETSGLNEFRPGLLDYIKQEHDIEHTPFGLHALVASDKDAPPGVIFVLKNRNNEINIDRKNRLRPFYMVYISKDSEVIVNHLFRSSTAIAALFSATKSVPSIILN